MLRFEFRLLGLLVFEFDLCGRNSRLGLGYASQHDSVLHCCDRAFGEKLRSGTVAGIGSFLGEAVQAFGMSHRLGSTGTGLL